jgi:hypothetical protein
MFAALRFSNVWQSCKRRESYKFNLDRSIYLKMFSNQRYTVAVNPAFENDVFPDDRQHVAGRFVGIKHDVPKRASHEIGIAE